jgi:hypothetical protein
MKQQINEIKRMQLLAGLITESKYQESLNEAEEAQAVAAIEKIEDKVADKVENSVDNLSDEQKAQLQKTLNSLGITADSNPKEVISMLQPRLSEMIDEAEGDTQKKVADALSNIGGGLVKSLLVPLIPLAVGQGTGTGFAGGLAITIAVAGLLIGAAKALGNKENSTETGNY